MLEQIPWQWVFLALVAYLVVDTLRLTFRPGLKRIPGPVAARFSKIWRVRFAMDGKLPFKAKKLHDQYGPIVRTGPNEVDISDPSVIPTIYGISSKFYKTPFYNTMSPKYQGTNMPSMFTERDAAAHKALKQPVASKFSMSSIRSFEPYVNECSDIFIAEMRKRAGQKVELAEWCQYYAFDVIGAITFQHRFGFMEQGKDVDNMMASIWFGLTYAGVVGQAPEWHPRLLGSPMAEVLLNKVVYNPIKQLIKTTEDLIEAYEKVPDHSERGDLLAWLRAEQVRHPGRISHRDLVNHLANNLLAGSDTTAISLRAVFYFLIKNPRCYQRQMEEISAAEDAGMLSEHVSYEECLKMPYLQAVMKEAMRMHPGIGYPLERYVPPEGASFCGFDLPAGTIVGVNPHVIHRDKEVFGPDADEFKPERWMEATPEQLRLMDRNFLAFGYGVRTCIGKNISIMEMGKLVPQVLRHFDLEWASDKPEWETHCYWMHKQKDMIVKFKPK